MAFVIEPLKQRVEVGRQNLVREFAERDGRMDYLQQQIDDLEERLANR